MDSGLLDRGRIGTAVMLPGRTGGGGRDCHFGVRCVPAAGDSPANSDPKCDSVTGAVSNDGAVANVDAIADCNATASRLQLLGKSIQLLGFFNAGGRAGVF